MNKTIGVPQPDSDVVNKQPRVLLIGYGWVGQYCGKYFTDADIVTGDGFVKKTMDHYDLGIIGVPTPMNSYTGACDVSIVDEVVSKYRELCDYFLIKSTVEIGTTETLSKKYGVDIAMSPEYVGETLGHPLLEARKDAFQIIGADNLHTQNAIASFWRKVLHANAPIYLVSSREAEIIKYCENYWIIQRVAYWNDVYSVCDKFNVSFDKVREGLVLDPRMSRTHSNVYPENLGWSGKCLPKDMNALAYKMRLEGRPLENLENMIKYNAEVRKHYKNSVKLIPDLPLWEKK